MQNYKGMLLGAAALEILSIACASAPAVAQQVAAGESGALEEIVVTANKRSENIQDVPLSVAVVTADQFAASGITSTEDMTMRIAGLTLQAGNTSFSPYIRGVGTTATGPGNETSVATYVDGVLISDFLGGFLALNNIQQVEIDKGPQGTLFGRNTTGGVISITTLAPSQDFHGSAEVGYANYNTISTSDYITGGITQNLAADLALYYSDQGEGYGKNLATGQDVYKTDNLSLRNKWLLTLGTADSFTLSLDYQHVASSAFLAENIVPGTYTNYGPGTTLAGQRPDLAPYVASGKVSPTAVVGDPFTNPGGRYDIDVLVQPRSILEQGGGSLKWQHDFDFAQAASISAYRVSREDIQWSPMPIPVLEDVAGWGQDQRVFTQELQLLSPVSSTVKWVGGLYYLNGFIKFTDPFTLYGSSLAPLERLNFFANQGTTSVAGFGQVTTPLIGFDDKTDVTLGLRYTQERKDINGNTVATLPQPVGTLPPSGLTDASNTFRKFTYRAALDHHFSEDMLGYISYNRGFKSGGFNMVPPSGPAATAVQPEVLDAFEVGFKSEWLDRRIRLNASAFYYKWTNMQVTVFQNATAITENAAKAKLYGVDLDLQAQITEHLRLSASAEGLHSQFIDYPDAQFNIPQTLAEGGGTVPVTASATGNNLPYAADATFDLAADYVVPLPRGQLGINVTWAYNSGYSDTADDLLKTGSFPLLNAQVQWTLPDRLTKLTFWAKNLTDTRYAPVERPSGNPGGYDVETMGAPRTYGVSAQRDF